jgi:hypothetical protein
MYVELVAYNKCTCGTRSFPTFTIMVIGDSIHLVDFVFGSNVNEHFFIKISEGHKVT